MLKNLGIILFLIMYSTCLSQNDRDKLILDSIEPYINHINLTKEQYFQTKKAIGILETDYGYEPDYKYRLLDKSYIFDDLEFFKQELAVLVEKYGFHVAYMSESESYFEAITKGVLKEWFKKMYLEKHFIWLQNNFEKQIDLRKLNELRAKDQLVNKYAAKLPHTLKLDSVQNALNLKYLQDFFYTNITDLYQITNKWSSYPTGKSFAIIQNNFGVVEFHNSQVIENFERYWPQFFPFYKKAYLNNQITYMPFRNHDNFSYLHYGFQKFGLISIKDIPQEYRKNDDEIPIHDIKFMNEVKRELKW